MSNLGKALRRFTEEEDQFLLDNWWDPGRRGQIARQTGRTATSLNLRYYRLLKELNIDPLEHKSRLKLAAILPNDTSVSYQAPGRRPPETEIDVSATKITDNAESPAKDLQNSAAERILQLEAQVSQLTEAVQNHNQKFTTWLENILYLFKSEGNALSMSVLMKENLALKEEIAQYRDKIAALEKQLIEERDSHERVFKELDFWLGQFLKLSSIEKVATLGDFVPRLKTIVDKYGTVLSYQPEDDVK
jgi:hypothetical protein